MSATASPHGHLSDLRRALRGLERDLPALEDWGLRLAGALTAGSRLLIAGNGGSAAHAQHLSAELVGRYRRERMPLSAIALHAETSTMTALVNDYGADRAFSRQVEAHGRAGDILLAISTSGRSTNLLHAAAAGHARGVTVWALTGPAPNPLAEAGDAALCVDGASTATIQEVHQVVVHLLCETVDAAVVRDPMEAAPHSVEVGR